jgi:glycosyltransferase involved in cell wall biosynthesis
MSGDGPVPALSLVVPVYDEEENVGALHAELGRIAGELARPYEIVFVNDGSQDGTLGRLEALAAADPHLRIVDLDGNFGEAAALSAGFAHARGTVIVTLDGDGQNDPADIPRLLARLEDGFDVVSGRRVERREAFLSRVLPSRVANWLIVRATGVPVYDCGCGLKAYRREVVAGAQLPRGMNRFLPAILGVDPSRVAEVPVRDRLRGGGQSHYGFERVFVVCRDLVALPLLIRRRARTRVLARTLGTTGAVLTGVGLAALVSALVRPGTHGIALAAALAALLAAAAGRAIGHNVDRFVTAQEEGVFRVRGVV